MTVTRAEEAALTACRARFLPEGTESSPTPTSLQHLHSQGVHCPFQQCFLFASNLKALSGTPSDTADLSICRRLCNCLHASDDPIRKFLAEALESLVASLANRIHKSTSTQVVSEPRHPRWAQCLAGVAIQVPLFLVAYTILLLPLSWK